MCKNNLSKLFDPVDCQYSFFFIYFIIYVLALFVIHEERLSSFHDH